MSMPPIAYSPMQQPMNIGAMTQAPPQMANAPNYYYGPQSIAAPPAQSTYALQQYLPLAPRRQLAPQENSMVQDRLMNGWYPKVMPGYSTPLSAMLSNPAKTATINGGITALATLLIGTFFVHPLAGIIGGPILGLITGVMSYFGSRQKNDNILDMMSRLPAGATRRDMLSDPVVQADRSQAAMASGGGGGFGSDLLTVALLSNMFNSGGGYRGGGRRR